MLRLDAPVPALPLDALRVAVGLIATAYFARLAWEAGDIVAAGGFYDHGLTQDLFWFTAQPVFHSWMGEGAVRLVYGVACVCALALAAGYRPRLAAACAYLFAVCSYRYSFLVVSVDDAIVHLLLGWMVLLPVGRTLGPGLLRAPSRAGLRAELEVWVPGLTLRLLLANVALVYLVAGLTKWQSPLWRQGDALLAVLKLPASRFPDAWSAEQSWLLRPLNWLGLGIEPLFALLTVLAPHTRVKRALGALLLGFHLLIALTLDVALANLGCIALSLVLFRAELTLALRARLGLGVAPPAPAPPERTPWPARVVASVAVALLYGAMTASSLQPSWRGTAPLAEDPKTEGGGPLQRAFVTGLWGLGLAQQYRLLDWIDERNYALTLEVSETNARGERSLVPPAGYLPHTMRGGITLSYLLGGRWVPIPSAREGELRASLQRRVSQRYCGRARRDAAVDVVVRIQRIDPVAHPGAEPLRHPLARFRCEAGAARDLVPTLRPARYEDLRGQR